MNIHRNLITALIIPIALFTAGCASPHVSKKESNTPPDHTKQYTSAKHILDGISFQYYYEDGTGLRFALADGMLEYEWIVGPRKGNKGEDIPYQSRIIGNDLYMVNWHEPQKPDFVTLIINLKESVLYSSAILRYGTEIEMIHFKEAKIKHIKRPTR